MPCRKLPSAAPGIDRQSLGVIAARFPDRIRQAPQATCRASVARYGAPREAERNRWCSHADDGKVCGRRRSGAAVRGAPVSRLWPRRWFSGRRTRRLPEQYGLRNLLRRPVFDLLTRGLSFERFLQSLFNLSPPHLQVSTASKRFLVWLQARTRPLLPRSRATPQSLRPRPLP